MLVADSDTKRLLESSHDHEAMNTPEKNAKITDREPQRAALADSQAELSRSRVGLITGLATLTRETEETELEDARYKKAKHKILLRYDQLRLAGEGFLLKPDPDEEVGADEWLRRGKVFNRYLSLTKTDLDGLGVDKLVSTLEPIVDAVETQADLRGLGFGEAMRRDFTDLSEAKADLQREWKEDVEAKELIQSCRSDLDNQLVAHALLVESVLKRTGRAHELGRYILTYDPSYAARRRAGVSITEEPEATTIAVEVSTAADAVAAPDDPPA